MSTRALAGRASVMTADGRTGSTRSTVTVGMIGGLVAVYFMVVGMVEKFDARGIIAGVIGLSFTLLAITAAGTGYMAARSRERAGMATGLASAASAGALAGAVAGALSAVTILAVDLIGEEHVRTMFQSFTPRLIEGILSFGRTVGFGAMVLFAAGVSLGVLGALLQQTAPRMRRAILTGLGTLLVISMAEPFLTQVFRNVTDNFGIPISRDWLYERSGMTVLGAILMFALGFAFSWWRSTRAQRATVSPPAGERSADAAGMRSIRGLVRGRAGKMIGFLAVLGLLILVPRIVGPFLSQVVVIIGIYVLLGLGLNIVVGFAGLLDLGYVAFFAVGAYAVAVFTSPASYLAAEGATTGVLNFWVALPIVVVMAIVAGLMIGAPVLRLRGDYLAIVTLGFGEIARVLIASNWLSEYLGGAQGILRIPPPAPEEWSLRRPQNLYFIVLAFVLIAVFVSTRLKDSRVGRAWAAMREDESVAEAMGVSVINYKLLAFGIGAGVGSLGGAIFAIQVGSVFPNSFDLLVSINALSVIVLGGLGSIPGVVVGALALVGLPELLREFQEFRLLIYGAVLVALMILRPEGLLPEVRRKRELHERAIEEEQYEEQVGQEGLPPVIETGPEERRE
ncbi:MAG TPA: leucine/isoleucine/valine transporter permease subunit [Actinomycetota bacterium]